MAREIVTHIEIDAPAARVWAVLTGFRQYAEWNPFIRSIEGGLNPGGELVVLIQPLNSKGMRFRPTVRAVAAGRKLRWLGRFFAPGLLDGEHCFLIEPQAESKVRLIHKERFGGVLVPLFWRSLNTNTRAGFEAMNKALKERAENPA